MKLSAKALIDLSEDKSSLRTSIRAFLLFLRISCLASFAASMFLAAIITCAFLEAKTLAVSKPIPLAPPTYSLINVTLIHSSLIFNFFYHFLNQIRRFRLVMFTLSY